jgi:hypothetical protein
MTNIYTIQLLGVLMSAAGFAALMATATLYGTPLTGEEKRRENRHGDVYRLPFRLETIAATLLLLAGVGILVWSKFEICSFLAYWLRGMPEALKMFLSCR